MKLFFVSLFLLIALDANAMDGSISIEYDRSSVAASPDLQATLGQVLGSAHRVYVSGELTQPSDAFPSSNRNYRLGIQGNYLPGLTLESGPGYFNGAWYVFVKATYQFDTGAK